MTTPSHKAVRQPHWPPLASVRCRSSSTLSGELAQLCFELGIRYAFGITGGGNGIFVDAIGKSEIEVIHCRHESGAAFAATEASLASQAPALVFATTGPGILNCLNGIAAARWEGAKVLFVTGITGPLQRGRWSAQETSSHTIPVAGIFTAGPLFHFAETVEQPAQLKSIAPRLAVGFQRPQGFVAHLALSISAQASPAPGLEFQTQCAVSIGCSSQIGAEILRLIGDGSLVLWVGFGARDAAKEVLRLAELTGARVMCTPRGKGTFPEDHPQYLGVTGMGGHDHVEAELRKSPPDWILVLGTRLGEGSSFWSRDLVPTRGFIHVDLDPEVPGAAYPDVPVHAVLAPIGDVLRSLIWQLPENSSSTRLRVHRRQGRAADIAELGEAEGVGMRALMSAIQLAIVDATDAIVMADAGNAFVWAAQELRFREPHRFRVSTGYGSMGHFATGVVGAALARSGKAVAIVGDGSMLMNNELSTAAAHRVPAVWVVLNDAGYSMVEQGMLAHGQTPVDARFPRVDFVALAKALGADGVYVGTESELDAALQCAIDAPGPFVVDVRVADGETSPVLRRVKSLVRQSE